MMEMIPDFPFFDFLRKIIWMQDAPIICKYEKRKGKPKLAKVIGV